MLTILVAKSKKQLKLFEEVPELLLGANPNFVPPFPGSIVKLFGPKSPYSKFCKFFPMIAYRDGKVVGRILANFNEKHANHYKDKVGFFGFFDFIDDIEAARALFEEAKKTLKTFGVETLRGPYNPTINDDCGLLEEGFDSPPMVMMPFNPPYYLEIYKKLGLRKARNLLAYYIRSDTKVSERVKKIVDRVKKSTGITLRSIDLKRLDQELPILTRIYNLTLDRNWGYTPISLEEVEFAADDLKAIADPNLVMIAERDGKPVGFSLAVPNINELMFRLKKFPKLLRVLGFLYLLKTKTPKHARLIFLGVEPEFRNTGIAALFYYESLVRGKNFEGGELSWVEENNAEIIKGITAMGAAKYKSYGIFEATA